MATRDENFREIFEMLYILKNDDYIDVEKEFDKLYSNSIEFTDMEDFFADFDFEQDIKDKRYLN
ncbi:hypothetical protein ACFL5N_01975 [bacterium]